MDNSTTKSTSEIGATAELAVANALCRAGLSVYTPFFNAHGRVDLVYENALGEVRLVQCKSGRLVNDVIMFYTCSHTGGVEREYIDDVDEFGVYCAGTGLVYMVPVTDATTRLTSLRVGPARNNQTRRVRWAEPYLLGPPW